MNINMMPKKGGAARNTRSLFTGAHGAGKGDKPREMDRQTFEKNYDQIDWRETKAVRCVKILNKVGKRTIIQYL